MADDYLLEVEGWDPEQNQVILPSGSQESTFPQSSPHVAPAEASLPKETEEISFGVDDPFFDRTGSEELLLRSISEMRMETTESTNRKGASAGQEDGSAFYKALSAHPLVPLLVLALAAVITWAMWPRARTPRSVKQTAQEAIDTALLLLSKTPSSVPAPQANASAGSSGTDSTDEYKAWESDAQRCHSELQAIVDLGHADSAVMGAARALQLALDSATGGAVSVGELTRSPRSLAEDTARDRPFINEQLDDTALERSMHSPSQKLPGVTRGGAFTAEQVAVGLAHGIGRSMQIQERLARETSQSTARHHEQMQKMAQQAARAAAASLSADHMASASKVNAQLGTAAQSFSVFSMLAVLVFGGLVSPLLAPCTCLPHFDVSGGGGIGSFRWPAKLLLAGLGLPYECGAHTLQLQPSCIVLAVCAAAAFVVASTVVPGVLLRWAAYAAAVSAMLGPTSAALKERWGIVALAGCIPFVCTAVVQAGVPYAVPTVDAIQAAQEKHSDHSVLSVQLRSMQVKRRRWWALACAAAVCAAAAAVLAAGMACSADLPQLSSGGSDGGVSLLGLGEVQDCMWDYATFFRTLLVTRSEL